jgi:hypothetical protein
MLNNVPTYYNNVLYPSKAEAKYAAYLDKEIKAGRVKWWKRQWPFKVEGDKIYTVITDFYVMLDREEVHEVKRGYYSPEFLYKSGLWLKQYPNLPYFICEPSGNGFSKTPLKEFMDAHLEVQPDSAARKYTKLEIFLSKCFYKLVSKIV